MTWLLIFSLNNTWSGYWTPQWNIIISLQWRHSDRDGVPNHEPHDCLLHRLFRHKLKKTSKLHVTGFCAWNSPVTGEFPTQRASNAENVSIWWRHHANRDCFFSSVLNATTEALHRICLCGWYDMVWLSPGHFLVVIQLLYVSVYVFVTWYQCWFAHPSS